MAVRRSSTFRICYTLLSIVILGYRERSVLGDQYYIDCCVYLLDFVFVTGTLTLSPMTVAPVCRVGDPLSITCTASVQFIRWSILQVNEQGTLVMVTIDANINSRDTNQMTQRVVNSATLTFMRTSAQGAPLISTLSIDSVTSGVSSMELRVLEHPPQAQECN